MKNIKLLSTLAISATLLTASAGVVSAAVVKLPATSATENTSGSAGFIKDSTTPITPQIPGGGGPDTGAGAGGGTVDPLKPDVVDPNVTVGDLAIYAHPKEFNFGVTKISAADKQKTTVTLTQKNWLNKENIADGTDVTDKAKVYSETYQSLRVYDGRVINDGWTVSASATTFKDAAGTKELAGAKIKIASATGYTTDTKGKVASSAAFAIEADSTTNTPDILKADPSARFYSDVKWDTDKVTLEFPGATIDTGNFSSTVTWTLAGTPDA